MQLWVSSENEVDPHSDGHKEFQDPCRHEWVETQSSIFKDSCSGSKINAEALPRLILTFFFVPDEKKALQTSMGREIIPRKRQSRT